VIDMHVSSFSSSSSSFDELQLEFYFSFNLNFKFVLGPAGLTFVTCPEVASDFSSRNPTFGLSLAPWQLHLKPSGLPQG
jgi:hypothetical protein